jgi:hypothetical protein
LIRATVTESAAGSRLEFEWEAMCDKCEDIQRRMEKFRRIGSQISDPLTVERFKAATAELEAEMAKLHPKVE